MSKSGPELQPIFHPDPGTWKAATDKEPKRNSLQHFKVHPLFVVHQTTLHLKARHGQPNLLQWVHVLIRYPYHKDRPLYWKTFTSANYFYFCCYFFYFLLVLLKNFILRLSVWEKRSLSVCTTKRRKRRILPPDLAQHPDLQFMSCPWFWTSSQVVAAESAKKQNIYEAQICIWLPRWLPLHTLHTRMGFPQKQQTGQCDWWLCTKNVQPHTSN